MVPLNQPEDRVEARIKHVDMTIHDAIRHITRDGSIEQKLELRSLFHNAMVILDNENPELKDANNTET